MIMPGGDQGSILPHCHEVFHGSDHVVLTFPELEFSAREHDEALALARRLRLEQGMIDPLEKHLAWNLNPGIRYPLFVPCGTREDQIVLMGVASGIVVQGCLSEAITHREIRLD